MNTFITILLTSLFILGCSLSIAQVPASFVSDTRKSKKKKDLIQSDFNLAGGLILVDAELNGSKEQFVFDTGAPHLFLNTKKNQGKKSKHRIVGVGGQQTLNVRKNVTVNWSGQEINDKHTYGLDLSHIERAKGKKIAGLLGYEMVKGKELFIDYKSQKLYLISKHNESFFSGHEKADRVFFRMEGHIPVVRVRFGKKCFYFGIDTGAEINVIDENLRGKIPKELIEEMTSTKVIGIQAEKGKTNCAKIKSTKVGKSSYENMEYVFADLTNFQVNNGFQLDGFLGYPFLKQANFSINYRKNQLIRWELITPNPDLKLVQTEEKK